MTDVVQQNLASRLMSALRTYEKETALRLNPDYLRLHVHPVDLCEWKATMSNLMVSIYPEAESKLLGIPLSEDPSVQQGHPVLKSTWMWVL